MSVEDIFAGDMLELLRIELLLIVQYYATPLEQLFLLLGVVRLTAYFLPIHYV